jgi:O-antigen ligase
VSIDQISDFLFRPEFAKYGRINRGFFAVILAMGLLIGSGVSVFLIAGLISGLFHLATGRLRGETPAPVKLVSVAFASIFAADLLSCLIHPTWIAFKEVFENLPFLGFSLVYAFLVTNREKLLETVERTALFTAWACCLLLLTGLVSDIRPEFMAGNPGVSGLLATINFAFCVIAATRRNGWRALVFALGAFAAAYLVLAAGTRALWPVLVLLPLSAALVQASRRGRMHAIKMLFGITLVLGVSGLVAWPLIVPRLQDAANSVQSLEKGYYRTSLGYRFLLMKAGYELWKEQPVFGYGPGNERRLIFLKTNELDHTPLGFSHNHNAIMNQALRSGIPGVAALLFLLAAPVYAGYRAKKDNIGNAGFALLCAILLIYIFSGSVGLLLGQDIHDSVFIAGICFAMYLIFGPVKPHEADIAGHAAEDASQPDRTPATVSLTD